MKLLEEVRTRRLVIVDKAGRERITLEGGWEDESCTFTICGRNGVPIVMSVGNDDQPQVVFRNSDGADLLTFAVGVRGLAQLTFNDVSGLPALRLSGTEGSCEIQLLRNGKVIWSVPDESL